MAPALGLNIENGSPEESLVHPSIENLRERGLEKDDIPGAMESAGNEAR
jgi:hypothetical protein